MHENPSILLLGQNSFLTQKINGALLEKKCITFVSNAKSYDDLQKSIGTKILSQLDFVVFVSYSTFLLNPKHPQIKSEKQIETLAQDLLRRLKVRGLFVYSYIQRNDAQVKTEFESDRLLSQFKTRVSILYIGDLVGGSSREGRVLGEMVFEKTLEKIINNKVLELPHTFSFYPIFGNALYSSIPQILFSLNSYNQRVALLGKPIKTTYLKRFFRHTSNHIKSPTWSFLKPEVNNSVLTKALVDETKYFDNKKALKVFLQIIKKDGSYSSSKQEAFEPVKTHKFRKKSTLFILLFIFISFPIWSLFISTALVIQGTKTLKSGDMLTSNILSTASRALLDISKPFVHISPLFSEPHSILLNQTEVIMRVVSTKKHMYALYSNLLSEEGDVFSTSDLSVTRDLQVVHDNLGKIQSALNTRNFFVRNFINSKTTKEELLVFKQQISDLLILARELPHLLGEENEQNYLLIEENSGILRPGGGKIGKVTLVTLSKGKIISTNIIDTEVGKSTFTEQVNSPKTYGDFFKDGWYLTNANIHPDFTATANQVLFFLDKQQDVEVDGVISLNSKTFLDNKSPLSVRDFYDKIDLLLLDLKQNKIQLFSKNTSVQTAFANLGWDGSIKNPPCTNYCYRDFVNYFELALDDQSDITREIKLQINLEEKVIKRKVALLLENKGDKSYKSYINMLVPGDSGFSPAKILDGENLQEKTTIFSSIGFKILSAYVEVPPFASKTILLSWEGDIGTRNNLDEYVLNIGKQGGMTDIEINTQIKAYKENIYLPEPDLSLTERDGVVYNAHLQQDKIIRLYFK